MTAHTHRCMRCDEVIPCLSPERCRAGESVLPRLMVQGADGTVHLFEHVCKGYPKMGNVDAAIDKAMEETGYVPR